MKKLVKVTTLLVAGALLLPSFSNNATANMKSCVNMAVKSAKVHISVRSDNKETKYKKDDSTEVLIDSDVKGKIVKILQHGDHFHVYTADGKEFITYKDIRDQYPDAEFGQYVGTHEDHQKAKMEEETKKKTKEEKKKKKNKKKNKKKDNKKNKKKKDKKNKNKNKLKRTLKNNKVRKWNGRRVKAYTVIREKTEKRTEKGKKKSKKNKKSPEDKKKPEKNKKKAEKSKKENKKKSEKNKKRLKKGENNKSKTKIEKNSKNKGKNKKSDKDEKNKKELKNSKKNKKGNKNFKRGNKKNRKKNKNLRVNKLTAEQKKKIKELNIIGVLGQEEVDRFDIVKILQHEDHFHIYDSKGNEGIVYNNPKELFPNATFGQYVGSHGDHKNENVDKNDNKNIDNNGNKQDLTQENSENSQDKPKNDTSEKKKEKKGSDVVSILVHGDHYHVYTADGREFITYSDPRSQYPDATFGVYHGSHGDLGNTGDSSKKKNGNTDNSGNTGSIGGSGNSGSTENGGSAGSSENHNDINTGSSDSGSSHVYDEESRRTEDIKKLNIIGVLGQNEVNRFDIVKILQHENHFHIYDSNGNEGIVYTNPKELYPNATFGQYVGNHGDNNNGNVAGGKFEWPEGITRIVDHGDHWHLYKGDTEVVVVQENPKEHYPNAEYIDERPNNNSNVEVTESDMFSYDDVKPELNDSIKYLDENLKKMENFGDLNNTETPVYGSDGEKNGIFYWLHENHYHAITIKQIIQNQKSGMYGDASARDIVAALKYIVEKRKTGSSEDDVKKEINDKISSDGTCGMGNGDDEGDGWAVLEYLKSNYKIKGIQVVQISNIFYIKNKQYDDLLTFNISDFKKVNGSIVYKNGNLPELKIEEKTEKEVTAENLEEPEETENVEEPAKAETTKKSKKENSEEPEEVISKNSDK